MHSEREPSTKINFAVGSLFKVILLAVGLFFPFICQLPPPSLVQSTKTFAHVESRRLRFPSLFSNVVVRAVALVSSSILFKASVSAFYYPQKYLA